MTSELTSDQKAGTWKKIRSCVSSCCRVYACVCDRVLSFYYHTHKPQQPQGTRTFLLVSTAAVSPHGTEKNATTFIGEVYLTKGSRCTTPQQVRGARSEAVSDEGKRRSCCRGHVWDFGRGNLAAFNQMAAAASAETGEETGVLLGCGQRDRGDPGPHRRGEEGAQLDSRGAPAVL